MAKKKENLEKETKKLTEELLKLLDFEGEVLIERKEPEESGEEVLSVKIVSPSESGLLIGAHGATLNAIQSFLAMALRQKTGEWKRVILDVGEWRERHEDYLKDLGEQAAERARVTGEPQYLYNLTPSQRRIIHVVLSKEDDIATESQGEGEGRYLVVKPK
jgi:spoIIIJ-associated protein